MLSEERFEIFGALGTFKALSLRHGNHALPSIQTGEHQRQGAGSRPQTFHFTKLNSHGHHPPRRGPRPTRILPLRRPLPASQGSTPSPTWALAALPAPRTDPSRAPECCTGARPGHRAGWGVPISGEGGTLSKARLSPTERPQVRGASAVLYEARGWFKTQNPGLLAQLG